MLETIDLEERLRLTRHIMSLLDQWEIPPGDQVKVLGLPEGTRSRSLRRYHDDTPLPTDAEVSKRTMHLLGIGRSLNTMFPRSAKMGARWLNRTNRHFSRETPARKMIDGGIPGLQTVHAHLDCTYFWDLTGSKS
ncbi:MAG TPA: DUF2384 domain-containing protein [Chromatiaceae bacterium]|jgi:hypothetical protein|nr:DUF2384 domain-containing protein [Chromatiaceae bacterium]HIN81472.1 DUF2384 domain-containing protein [Chromatiales bacterium]HIA08771.1 DUF2384 domain-containing protein [Chromatiaceae bacterium]HIB83484.1 DUF2384 domain-containing protein [Chromatiaceae bacterium]HIO14867.1 DUF2384 domain-containing protein [Chromatiales bacterium]